MERFHTFSDWPLALLKCKGKIIKNCNWRQGSHRDEEYPSSIWIEFEDGSELYVEASDDSEHHEELGIAFKDKE